ncbi:immunity protein Imm33 domain-containing protein [Sphingopyxis flava]
MVPVRFIYRQQPHNPQDSGWVFPSGTARFRESAWRDGFPPRDRLGSVGP